MENRLELFMSSAIKKSLSRSAIAYFSSYRLLFRPVWEWTNRELNIHQKKKKNVT